MMYVLPSPAQKNAGNVHKKDLGKLIEVNMNLSLE